MENVKEAVVEFEKRLNIKVKKQKKLDIIEESDFKREELLGKYIVKVLYK